MGGKIYIEENNIYQIDCTKALWSSNCIHSIYHEAKVQLSDVDFVIEDKDRIMLIEYKNANVKNAVNAIAFNPNNDKKRNDILKKYYDSLHYLWLIGKMIKPKEYIYILEYPNGDSTSRKMLRNKLKPHLPFTLQENMKRSDAMISKFIIMSIDEWNSDKIYRRFPITKVKEI